MWRTGASDLAFENMGIVWIVLKCLYFGVIGFLLGHVSFSACQRLNLLRFFPVIFCCISVTVARLFFSDGLYSGELPIALSRSGPTMGSINLRCSEISLKTEDLEVSGPITDIKVEASNRLRVTCTKGSYLIDERDKVLERTRLDATGNRVVALPTAMKSQVRYVNVGGEWSGPEARMYDSSGKTVYKIDTEAQIDWGDVNEDEKPDFVLFRNTNKGYVTLTLLDELQHVIWSKDQPDSTDFAILKGSSNSKGSIVLSDLSGNFFALNVKGEIVHRWTLPLKFYSISACPAWPNSADTESVIIAWGNEMWIVSNSGKVLRRLPAPSASWYEDLVSESCAISVKLDSEKPNYLAVLVWTGSPSPQSRSTLYLYDDQGALVYQETFRGTNALSKMASPKPGTESLLIGGTFGIRRYFK